jgi:exodeoxyribonuclease V alpha subunit
MLTIECQIAITTVYFGDGRTADYERQEIDLLELAYACTIHKSQGSEYQSVIVNIQTQHYIMLKRPLVYTAITRASKQSQLLAMQKPCEWQFTKPTPKNVELC